MQIQLYIENNEVDIQTEGPMPLNFSLTDIRKPEKRRNAFSKTITLPGTRRNNELFAHIYNLDSQVSEGVSNFNIGPTFNRKKQANFLLIYEGASIMSGTAQLTAVDVTDDEIEYKIVLYSELTNIITEISDHELQELNGPALEHLYTLENISGSWSGNEAYIYPVIDCGSTDVKMTTVTMCNLKPAVFVSWYWDKIFEEANFTYTGSFTDSDLWKSLIIPHTKDSLEPLEAVEPAIVTNSQINNETWVTQSLPLDVIIQDNQDLYNEGTATFTAPITGRYDFNLYGVPVFRFLPDNGDSPNSGDQIYNKLFTVYIHLYINGVEYEQQGNIVGSFLYQEELGQQGIAVERSYTQPVTAYFDGVALTAEDQVQMRLSKVSTDNDNPFFNITTTSDWPGTIEIIASPGTLEANFEQETIPGSELVAQQIIPRDIKQGDFILGLLRMFNLFLVPDPDRPKHMLVKTRDEFYDTFVHRDWTDKLDTSRPIRNELIRDGLVKTLQYKYKHDEDDYYLDLYKQRWGREYGELRIDTGYDFGKTVKDALELPFGTILPIGYRRGKQSGEFRVEVDDDFPDVMQVQGLKASVDNYMDEPSDLPKFSRALIGRTVRINDEEYTITDMLSPWRVELNTNVTDAPSIAGYRIFNTLFFYTDDTDDKIVPALKSSNDNGLTFKPFDSEMRIAAFNGTIPANTYTIQQTPQYSEGQSRFRFKQSVTKTIQTNNYPFVSHVLGDSPAEPTFDLLFNQPNQIFWGIGVTYIVDEFGNNLIDENDNIIIG